MERLEDLNLSGLKIYQDDEKYCFTSDAVLLSRFARVKKGDVVADFCSGSGIVGIHLYGLNPQIKSMTLFEMQKSLYDLSLKSIAENRLEKVFNAVNCKVQDVDRSFNGFFSLIVCNPPYEKVGSGEHYQNPEIDVCRREAELPLTELIKAVSFSLKYGGRFCICHRADRLIEVISALKNEKLEPKILQFVSGKDKQPYLFLMEAVKGGKSGIKVFNTLIN